MPHPPNADPSVVFDADASHDPDAVAARMAQALEWLERTLCRERLTHSLGARDKAGELARKFGLPESVVQQAQLGGLLHDCAKWMPPGELLQYCEAYGIALSPSDRACPQTVHALVGADLAQRELGVNDTATLAAIRAHTTGEAAMGLVEKLVFVADKIESNTRNPLFVRKTTECLDYRDSASLDTAMLYLLNDTIALMLDKGQMIHPRAIETRNALIAAMKARREAPGNPLARDERRTLRIEAPHRPHRL